MEASTLTHASRGGLLGRRSPLLKLQGDERLVAMIRAGNEGAFEALFERYHTRLLAFCRHMLRSTEDAEDVLQEVFVKAHAAMLADQRHINVRPWLYRIARNRCLNHLRKPVPDGQDSMDVLVGEHGVTTADRVQRREDFRALVADVQDLPETQRTALLLRELDALSYEEIAETMDTTVPAVKSLLVRARMSLAEATHSRQLTCGEVRLELAEAAEGLRKASGPARRHIKRCDPCHEYRTELRSSSKALAALAPIGPLALAYQFVVGKLGGLGGSSTAGGTAATGGGGAVASSGAVAGTGAAGAAGSAAATAGGGGAFAGGAAAAGSISSAIGAKAAATAATAALLTAGAVEVRQITAGKPAESNARTAAVAPHHARAGAGIPAAEEPPAVHVEVAPATVTPAPSAKSAAPDTAAQSEASTPPREAAVVPPAGEDELTETPPPTELLEDGVVGPTANSDGGSGLDDSSAGGEAAVDAAPATTTPPPSSTAPPPNGGPPPDSQPAESTPAPAEPAPAPAEPEPQPQSQPPPSGEPKPTPGPVPPLVPLNP